MDRNTFIGSPVRIAGTVVVSLVVLVALAFLFGVFGVPSVVGVENSFGAVNNSTTTIETDLVVSNPNPIGVSLGGVTVNYTVSMNDVRMASGQNEGVSVSTGNSTLPFTTHMRNERIPPWWVSHVRNGEQTTVQINATVRSATLGGRQVTLPQERQVETDIIGQFNSEETRPIDANQALVDDPVLYVNETSAAWNRSGLSAERTPINMSFLVYNPKAYPYAVSEIGYTITMNNITVGEGSSEDVATVAPGTTERLQTRTAIRNGNLDDWWVSHLERNQVTDLRIDFYLVVDPQGGASTGAIRIPLDAVDYQRTVETDIFGTKNGSASASAGGEAESDTGSTSTDDSQSTQTPSGSDSTPTDDGGLLGGDDSTPTDDGNSSPTPDDGTATPTSTEADDTATPTDDGGLLS